MKKLGKVQNKGILRIIDANFNRCKEGLRVLEDIFRFAYQYDSGRRKVRRLRHSLDSLIKAISLKKGILNRNSQTDPGRKLDSWEAKSKSLIGILDSNFQRVKESLRVLEECFKLAKPACVWTLKKMRYEIYQLEKNALKKRSALSNPRFRGN